MRLKADSGRTSSRIPPVRPPVPRRPAAGWRATAGRRARAGTRRAAEDTRHEPERVRDVGDERRVAEEQEGREADERARADDGVERSSRQARRDDEPGRERAVDQAAIRPAGVTPDMVGGMRPFTFLADAREPMSGPKLAEAARRAEAIGFHALVVPDHLIEQLSPVAAMATIAAATDELRIGTFVLNNDLRHPAVLAQELARLDVLSGGRLDDRHRRRLEPARVRRHRPAVRSGRRPRVPGWPRRSRCSRAASRDGPFSFAGEHYTITELRRPAEAGPAAAPAVLDRRRRAARPDAGRPRGGHRGPGAARSCRAARRPAQHDDGGDRGEDRLGARGRRRPLRRPRSSTSTRPAWPVAVTDDARAEAASRSSSTSRGRTGVELTVDEVLESPHLFIGSIDGLVEKFRMLRERLGISSFMVGDVDELAPVVERLAGHLSRARQDLAEEARQVAPGSPRGGLEQRRGDVVVRDERVGDQRP